MTPERKQWWDSLPQREKMLHEQILDVKREISMAKYSLQLGCFKPKAIKLIIAGMKKQKVTLTALKHELNRGIKDVDVEYCPWCGGEIKGGDNERADCQPVADLLGRKNGHDTSLLHCSRGFTNNGCWHKHNRDCFKPR